MFNKLSTTHELNVTTSSYTHPLQDVFYKLFKGRTDRVGLATTNSTTVSSEEELFQHVSNHLNGTCRLGFYNLLPDGTCPWAMIEFEAHEDKVGLPNPHLSSIDFISHLNSVGIHCYRELSKNKNRNCYHVWIFFSQPISAKKVLFAFKTLVNDVMNIKTEVFPKGYNAESVGNFVWLPFFGGADNWGNGVQDGQTLFIDEHGEVISDQYDLLTSIKLVNESDLDRLVAEFELLVDEKPKKAKNTELIDGLDKVRLCSFMKHCEDKQYPWRNHFGMPG